MDTSRTVLQLSNLTAMGLSLAQEDTAFVLNAGLSENEAKARAQETKARLKSCCAGLLELRHRPRDSESDEEPEEDIEGHLEKPVERISSGQWTVHGNPEILYLHRSIADFLEKPDVWMDIEKGTMRTEFDAYSALLRSCVVRMKTSARVSCYVREMVDVTLKVEQFTGRAAEEELLHTADSVLDISLKEKERRIMSHYEDTLIESVYQEAAVEWIPSAGQVPAPRNTFLAFALNVGFTMYVKEQFWKHGSALIWPRGLPLLGYACVNSVVLSVMKPLDQEIIEILLGHVSIPMRNLMEGALWRLCYAIFIAAL